MSSSVAVERAPLGLNSWGAHLRATLALGIPLIGAQLAQLGIHTTDMVIVGQLGAEKLAALRGVSVHTVRSWGQRGGIPAEHWATLEAERLATLKELAEYAAANPRKRPVELARAS